MAEGFVGGDDVVLDYRELSLGNSGVFDEYLFTRKTDSTRSFLDYQLHDAVMVIVLAGMDHSQRRRLRDHGRK